LIQPARQRRHTKALSRFFVVIQVERHRRKNILRCSLLLWREEASESYHELSILAFGERSQAVCDEEEEEELCKQGGIYISFHNARSMLGTHPFTPASLWKSRHDHVA
jgi:hypothetical protein